MGKGVWVVWIGVEVEGWTAGVVVKATPTVVLEVETAAVRWMGR